MPQTTGAQRWGTLVTLVKRCGVRRCPPGVALAGAVGGTVALAGMGREIFRPSGKFIYYPEECLYTKTVLSRVYLKTFLSDSVLLAPGVKTN